jgi:type II secretory pathway pseudopilin PulG
MSAFRRLMRSEGAFTLLEVLVATGVLATMMVILLGSLSSSMSLWRTTESKISADREGRSAHFLLYQDLASAYAPTNTSGPLTNRWPQINPDGTVIKFLTLKPVDYQASGEVGDICTVEYSNSVISNAIYRRFMGSKDTYDRLKSSDLMPTPTNAWQLLADYVIPNTNAAKPDPSENVFITPNFVGVRVVPTNSGIIYQAAGSQRPDAIEVNISTADMEAVKNIDTLNQAKAQIRSASFFSFRVNLPGK